MLASCVRPASVAALAAMLAGSPACAQGTETWPHTITQDGARVTIYQPQAVSWSDQRRLIARAAVAIEPAGESHEVLGTIEVALATAVDQSDRMVRLSNAELLSSRFPSLDTQRASALEAKIRAALARREISPEPLDAILLSLKQMPPANAVAVNNEPPTIFYAGTPASLVVFDGDPVLAPAGKSGLSYAVNTNWYLFADNGSWFLLDNGLWLTAAAATGPYAPASSLPPQFARLPADKNFAEARKSLPLKPAQTGHPVPIVFVSVKPAEIIVTDGPPQFDPVPGRSLERVSNTANVLFHDAARGTFYYLISGRWFATQSLEHGPWHFAGDSLPPDFALLPDDGPDANVLASVPGTVQAQEAVLKAGLPSTATLSRSKAHLRVAYSGPPQFKPIPGTPVEYAVNTNDEVLKIGEVYYACYRGAWFISNAPTGPWVLTDSVPQAIYSIPPASPVYNVTYVKPYSATPGAVTFGYTAGYLMGFVTAGVVVYGTGYYYPPVVYPGPVPIYYPYPYTYAGNVWYDSSTGSWARGGTVYGPYGGAASGGRYYNPATGAWAQGGAIYGPNGGAGAWSYYNPRTGTYSHGTAAWGGGSGVANASFYNPRYGVSGMTSQNANLYSRWGSSTITGPTQTVHTQSRSNASGSAGGFSSTTGAEGAGYHNRATESSGGAVRGAGGDVYAGRDGNVYRHTDDGWSKWNSGAWQPVNTSGNAVAGSARGQGETARSETAPSRNQIDTESYRQLQYDRLGRQAGMGGGFSRSADAGERLGGGRFRR